MKQIKLPKYQQIRGFLLEKLSDGSFSPGKRFYSEHQLMSQFNVSNLTARKALSYLEDEGLIRKEHGAGRFVVRLPEKPRLIKVVEHRTVGIMTGEVNLENNLAVGQILINIHKAATEKGYMISLGHNSARQLLDIRVDGIIVVGFLDQKNIELLKKSDIPVIGFGAVLKDHFPCISSDYRKSGFDVCSYFYESGHRKIMTFGSGKDAVFVHKDIFKGMKDFTAAGRLPASVLHRAVRLRQNDYKVLKEALASEENRPDALFLMNWLSIPPVLQAINERGLKIPKDISVIVNGINALAANTNPPLSVVYSDLEHGCNMAMEMLTCLIRDKKCRPDNLIYENRINQRGSCATKKAGK